MILRGLRDLDLSDDSVTMGDLSDDSGVDDLSDLADAQNRADSQALDVRTQTALPSSSSSFDWTSALNTGVSALQRFLGGGSSKPPNLSASQAALAAQQAAASRNTMLMVGLGGVAIVGGVLLLRRKA